MNSVDTDAGLELLIRPEPWNYRSYTEPIYGFFVFIHHPNDFVDFPVEWYTFQPSYHVKILIRPDVISSSRNIGSLSVKQRQCILQEENFLDFAKIYSHWSCLSECRAREIMKSCKCIPFYYPQISN